MNPKSKLLLLVVSAVGMFLLAGQAQADIMAGVRVGAYTDRDAGAVGGELLMDIAPAWYFNPNVEYVFVDRGDLFTFNLDFHYDFPTRAPIYFWLGAGPAILYRDPEGPGDGDTDFGANLFLGVGFNKGGRIIPYIQPKVIVSDDSEFALTFGVRF